MDFNLIFIDFEIKSLNKWKTIDFRWGGKGPRPFPPTHTPQPGILETPSQTLPLNTSGRTGGLARNGY